ncbi:hypothetical protein [Niabella ginsengisoli]|uniref:Uncharacterized protein n=1 Tax=Niabella ginsengisoli TaxID=522298 RepID=A0ABS9SQU1_9BACT|nr:hypothetical protein [Niabella ginsengisoli]MCH5600710.1 hypothetical protein [Niabella ginsengisoli]
MRIKNELKISLLQNKLLNVYIKGKFYTSFDSLYPIAQSLSERLQTENTLKNYLLKTVKYFASRDFDRLYSFTESILPVVKKTNLDKLTYSTDLSSGDFKKFIQYQLRLYNAFSQIKQESTTIQNEGYKNFLSLSNDSLIASFAVIDREIYSSYRISSLLLNYQAKYYFDKGIYDSAAILYAEADNQKYRAIREYEERLAINGSLLYQAAKDEEEIAYKRDILKKKKKLFLTYKLMAGGALISSLILLFF